MKAIFKQYFRKFIIGICGFIVIFKAKIGPLGPEFFVKILEASNKLCHIQEKPLLMAKNHRNFLIGSNLQIYDEFFLNQKTNYKKSIF